MEERVYIADPGKIYVKGKDMGQIIYLGENDSIESWTQIDESELLQSLETLGFA